ncbi:MAG: hypothetical protein QW416_04590 [Candidatus Nitrosocaldaceae archaeon]
MHKILFSTIIIGIIISIIGLSFIAMKLQSKLVSERIVNNATIKFDNQDTNILVFNASSPSYRLKIDIELLETKYGGMSIKPLAYIMMIDDQGLNEMRSNKTISYAYLAIEGLEESKSFNINNLSGNKRYYLLFSTPLPEQEAKVNIDMIYSKREDITLLDTGIVISGMTIIIVSLISRRITR